MNRRERLTAIFEGRIPDRPAVKLWGLAPEQPLLHPAFRPVYDIGIAQCDLLVHAGSPFHLYCGVRERELIQTHTRPTDSPEWVEQVTTLHTPLGPLTSVHTRSTLRRPGYEKEYLLKEPHDIRKLLAVPYQPYPFDPRLFAEAEGRVGEAGRVCFDLDHAMYGLQRLVGSENFGLWNYECPELMLEAMNVFACRIADHARAALNAGIRGIFGWVGPELCIPPLMSPADFERYVFALDQPLIDLIHEGGGRVWVHCHGKMGPVLERFLAMGVDVLNPVEPPPMGDLTLAEAFARVGDRMALEGNIETHELMTASPQRVRALVREAIDAGRDRRLILCPSAGYMEDPDPTERHMRNLCVYVEEAVRYAEEGKA